jgi:hypothetical protein
MMGDDGKKLIVVFNVELRSQNEVKAFQTLFF